MNQLRGKCPGAGVTGRRPRGGPRGPHCCNFPSRRALLALLGPTGICLLVPGGCRGDNRDPAKGAVPGTGWAGPVGREVGEAWEGKAAPARSTPLLSEGHGGGGCWGGPGPCAQGQVFMHGATCDACQDPTPSSSAVRKLTERTNS